MTAPFEDNFDRPDAAEGPAVEVKADAAALASDAASASGHGKDAGPFLDGGPAAHASASASAEHEPSPFFGDMPADAATDADHRPSNLGPNWSAARTNVWHVENGRLCGENAKNHGVWLNKVLPINARIEFDAWALTDQGDLKAEVWGDGRSYALGTSYTTATSYLPILGGWHNSLHVLARLNEHGTDRKEIKVDKDSDDPRQRSVVRGQLYQFKIERSDSKTVKVWVNGVEYFSWTDPAPLLGYGHDHLGFNNWEAKVCFDNVKVTPF
jgi:hypothetical protein